jgi:hypothetical protein
LTGSWGCDSEVGVGLTDKLRAGGPKRLLSVDGGGIRGIVALEILGAIEAVHGRLSDYFDYVAGTSAGAILAACISRGMTVKEIRDFYLEMGGSMFEGARLTRRHLYKYSAERISSSLRRLFAAPAGGGDLCLGSPELETLLLLVLRNATTDSPWPLTNNPAAKYNDRALPDCNLDLPLWRLVRASTAAPTYFPPEQIRLATKDFVFVDGGVTPYNNPSFLLFLSATLEPYRLCWPTGPDKLLVVSVGTGFSSQADATLRPDHMHLFYSARSVPTALIGGANVEQDLLCRAFGRCLYGPELDGELGDLQGGADQAATNLPKLFTYLRYTADLSPVGLDRMGLSAIKAAHLDRLDAVDHLDDLRQVGAAAARAVDRAHFRGFERAPHAGEPLLVTA